jgi:subtilisin family serine protease/subtilisin-like proprotein convertase family protein
MSLARKACAKRDVFRRVRLFLETLEGRDLPSSTLPTIDGLTTDSQSYSSNDILVRWLNNTPAETALDTGMTSLQNGLYSVALKSGVSVSQAVAYYSSLSGVAFAQPDYTIHADQVPNDPSFSAQWALQNTGQTGGTAGADISATTAWDTTTGSNIIVAVVDSGVDYNHQDIAANMWHNPTENSDGISGDLYGANFVGSTPTGDPMDDFGHGTHVAGIIGAVGNNGIGVSGVAWNVQLMAVKFLDSTGSGSTANAVKAINWAVSHGAKVINNSWGGGGYNSALDSAIANARNQGVIFVAAAGNYSSNNDTSSFYPADYTEDNVVSVAATDANDNLASFSDYGPNSVGLAAPGVNILSTLPNNSYGYMSGTSMATPFVTGAAALVWSAHPSWTYSQVISDIYHTVDPVASLKGVVATGGVLDVAKAVNATDPGTLGGPIVTGVDWTGDTSTQYQQFRLTFIESIDPTTFTTGKVTITGPTGASVAVTAVQPVSGSNNTQFDVFFTPQTQTGVYAISVGPNICDTQGREMDQNGNRIAGESTDAYQTKFSIYNSTSGSSGNVNIPIRGGQTATATLTIGTHMTIADLNATINISDNRDSSLVIQLVSPTGVQVTLSNARGGTGANFTNTTFDDQAGTAISAGRAPFTGSFRPDGTMSSFNGADAYGTWTLVVSDVQRKNTGTILNFSVTAFSTAGGSSVGGSSVGSNGTHGSDVIIRSSSNDEHGSLTEATPTLVAGLSLPAGSTAFALPDQPHASVGVQQLKEDHANSSTWLQEVVTSTAIHAPVDSGEPFDGENSATEVDAALEALFVRI